MERSTRPPAQLVCDFSLHRPTSKAFERFVAIAGRPLRWTDRHEGHWIALDEATVHAVLADPYRFSSECIIIPRSASVWPRPLIPEEIDPPRHAEYRRVVAAAFSPPAIGARHDDFARVASSAIDRLVPGSAADLMGAIARPVGVGGWALVVGLSEAETESLLNAHRGLSSPDSDAQLSAVALVAALEGILADRRADPRDDVPSSIVHGRIEGRTIDEDEAADYLFLLALAGIDTVASVLGYLLRELAMTPALQERVATDRSCRRRVVDEALRRFAVVNTARTVTVDTELAGVELLAGDRILIPTCAANLDPALHDDPLAFDVDRPPQRHLAFGVGPHRCLGAHLARALLGVVLDHLGPVRFRPAEDLEPCATAGLIHGMARLPVEVLLPD